MSVADRLRAYAGLGARVVASRLGSRHPFKITLALTERCDCRCQACFIWQRPKGREPTPEEVGGWLASAPSLRWVNLTGGELFLRDDIPAVAAAVRAALPRLAVLDFPTTGQRTARILDDVAQVAGLGIPHVVVTTSVEGPPALHDRLRGREGAFDRMVATFAGLRQMPGVRAMLGMTLSDANADRVPSTLAAVRRHVPDVGWRDLHLNVFTTSAHYYDNEASPLAPPRDVARALARARRAREGSVDPTDQLEAAWLRLLPEHLATGRSPLPCQALRASVFVDVRGDVHPCTVWGVPLGNLRERSLPAILATAQARRTRQAVARDRCPGCWSPCEAGPTIVAHAPGSLLARPRRRPVSPAGRQGD